MRVNSSTVAPSSPTASSPRSKANGSMTIINESIISLMLQLHSKYSGKNDSYVPGSKRKGISVTKEYRYEDGLANMP